MLTESEFNSYYNSQILPELVEFERYRKSQLFEYRVWLITRYLCLSILLIITFLYLGYLSHNSHLSHVFVERILANDIRIFLLINLVIVFIAIFSKNKMKELGLNFSYASKYELFGKIVSAYHSFRYFPLSGIDAQTVISSKLFSGFNKLESEDYIQGTYKKLDIKLSEVELINSVQYQKLNDNQLVTITEDTTVFKGLFIITSVNKSFSSETYVVPNTWLKFFNSLPHYLNRVVLEDPDFETAFDVYSNDQIEARYLLTPSFMERLVEVNKNYKIRCYFINKQMLMAIELNEEFLPLLELSKPISYETIKQVYNQFNIIFNIIDALKLDMNIGL